MKLPLSWLKDFVNLDLPMRDLAHRLTLAGLEVEEVRFVGLPLPPEQAKGRAVETKVSGLEWDPEKIVVGEVREVLPHPQADRLVLARVADGAGEHTIVTGAPNLFPFRGQGPLARPIKIAYAREGSRLYDGHQPGWEMMTLKRAKIRGVESASMACSEKELGISEDHEGVILLDDDAPVGQALAEYMGDVVFDISLTPNLARDANVLGVAREIRALTGQTGQALSTAFGKMGDPIAGRASVEIRNPDLNPRFVLGLLEGVRIGPSPYWVQRRLRLAGMRPINNVVDATNYTMLEVGQPLHAFDYQALVHRAGGKAPRLVTRLPQAGETLTTLDGVPRRLDEFTVLVADGAGALSMAGVMGGAETEVTAGTVDVLLEGAAWNFLNIRRTLAAHRFSSEAAYRFSRGVHPALAEIGVQRGLMWMQRWAGGTVAQGLVDEYPAPRSEPVVDVDPADVLRWLGISLSVAEIGELLERLEFGVQRMGAGVRVTSPAHRLDIGEGVVGQADVMEEIARIYGYDRVPETLLADELPSQRGNAPHEREERVRDRLAALGLQEIVTYRITSPEREAALRPGEGDLPHIRLANPIAQDRTILRRSLLGGMLEVAASNIRREARLALFELGPVFHPRAQAGPPAKGPMPPANQGSRQVRDRPMTPANRPMTPDEPMRLGLILSGRRDLPGWQPSDAASMDFFDVKGVVEAVLRDLRLRNTRWETAAEPTYHPGKCARLVLGESPVGFVGEIHPAVLAAFDLGSGPVAAAEIDLTAILEQMPDGYPAEPVPAFPPVLEDLALIVEEALPAAEVERGLRAAGGGLLADVRLFDVYRGDPIPRGKKSLAFSLVLQATDRTLTEAEVGRVRSRIVEELGKSLGVKLRE